MKSKSYPPSVRTWLAAAATLIILLCAGPAGADDDAQDLRSSAFELYDQGRYAEARPLLERLAGDDSVDGVLLYRLYYCQRVANDPAARNTLERTRVLLEQELDTAPGLEIPFYLANAYRNAGRVTDARVVAKRTTDRVESGDLAAPADGFDMFRLGKLYADQERQAEAAEWYAKSLELLAADESGGAGPYVEWAARHLIEQAWKIQDYESAADYLALITAGDASAADLDRLAMANCRLERYGEAQAAWQRAEKSHPADANRPRYCWHLAEQAAEIGRLPGKAPDGRPWADLSKEELEQLMLDRSNVVGEAMTEVGEATKRVKKKRYKQLQAAIDDARPAFLGAALEYALRGYPIRETAFFGGYAPLIFHSDKWRLPPR
jgi:hypothetical protein